MENKLQVMAEKLKTNVSKNYKNICKRNLFERAEAELCHKENRCLPFCGYLEFKYIKLERLWS